MAGLRVEVLEDRLAPAIFVVNTAADENNGIGVGSVSLREAITAANATVAADTINFNIGAGGLQTINLDRALPVIARTLTINGTSQPGAGTAPRIELNGTAAGAGVSGLRVNASGTVIRGLAINRFTGHGIVLQASNGAVEGCFIGTNAAGTADLGNGLSGVAIAGIATGTRIGGTGAGQRNIISGNDNHGVVLIGVGVSGTLIQGNLIGTDVTSAVDLGNTLDGIALIGGARNNSIGRTAAGGGFGNVIAGNNRNGILMQDPTTTSNLVLGNVIGSNISGIAGLGNGAAGVAVTNAKNNVIGRPNADANVIVSNVYGVAITGVGATGNRIHGNTIGFVASTGVVRANQVGVWVGGGASGNTIGGAAAVVSNTISGNTGAGVVLIGPGTINNTVSNNFIGTDSSGTAAKGNGGDGISIGLGARSMIVQDNLISSNGGNGVSISGAGVTGIIVRANTIGLNRPGTAKLANGGSGVRIGEGASNTVIGGTTVAVRNLIGGNSREGIDIGGIGTNGNKVQGNFIGINAAGNAEARNQGAGVFVHDGAKNTLIGGTVAGAGNVIGGHNAATINGRGVVLDGVGTTGNLIQGNRIGTNAAGTAAVPNTAGVEVRNSATNNLIGGTVAGARNVISGNVLDGVRLIGTGTSANLVQGNFIGTDLTGTADLGNAVSGVLISVGATNNVIGGTTPAARNVISGSGSGVRVAGVGTIGNLVQGNFIGTDVAGLAAVGNGTGILIESGATNNVIGGTTAAVRNVVSGNTAEGVLLTGAGTSGNRIQGNFIGVAANGATALGNGTAGGNSGVLVTIQASGNTIGGTVPGAGNRIANNAGDGVLIGGAVPAGVGNSVLGNSIFANAKLGINLGADDGLVTGNDSNDADSGPNGLQNFPVLTTALDLGNQLYVSGTLDVVDGADFRIEFFSSPTADASGHGEGQTFLGFVVVFGGFNTDVPFTAMLAAPTLLPGQVITATATNLKTGDTSEFSLALLVF